MRVSLYLYPKKGILIKSNQILKTLRRQLSDRIPLMESDQYVNDPDFDQAVFQAFEMIQKNK